MASGTGQSKNWTERVRQKAMTPEQKKLFYWKESLALARDIRGHTGSCWNTGGTAVCDGCMRNGERIQHLLLAALAKFKEGEK
jgi:hypothetical protein